MSNDIESTIQIYNLNPGSIYTKRFFRRLVRATPVGRIIGKYLAGKFEVKSACDIGCGLGCFLEGMLDAGVTSVVGIEYMYNNAKRYVKQSVLPYIRQGDASKPLDVGIHDFVMSVEVAEHIPPECSKCFADNLVAASSKWVFLTAGHPGQKGTAHINCRPQGDWIDMMRDGGFELQQPLTDRVGKEIRQISGWRGVRKNLMVFQKVR